MTVFNFVSISFKFSTSVELRFFFGIWVTKDIIFSISWVLTLIGSSFFLYRFLKHQFHQLHQSLIRKILIIYKFIGKFYSSRNRIICKLNIMIFLELLITPLIIVIHSFTEGSSTSIFWNLLDKAWFLENTFLYSWNVVDPIHLILPLANSGFSKFETSSEPPPAEPAPIIVWISSMNKIGFSCSFRKLITSFILFQNHLYI